MNNEATYIAVALTSAIVASGLTILLIGFSDNRTAIIVADCVQKTQNVDVCVAPYK